MIEGRDIICFGEDWGRHPSSTQHIIKKFTESNRVLWVNSISYRSPQFNLLDILRLFNKFKGWIQQPQHENLKNLHIYSPIAFPFYQSNFFRRINKFILKIEINKLIRRLKIEDPILWISVPTAVDMVDIINNSLAIYYCGDEFSEFPGVNRFAIKKLEAELLRKTDLVIVSSKKLEVAKKYINTHTFLVTHGVEFQHFNNAINEALQIPEDTKSISHPIIGFYGILADWVDIDLIEFLAKERPFWSFVIIGNSIIDIQRLKTIKNIYLMGPKSYKELPSYAKVFDVALIPFKVNKLTEHVFPLKFMEYFAMGLPVVATNLPELISYQPLCKLAKTKEDFLNSISEYLKENSNDFKKRRIEIAKNESWDKKFEDISELIENNIRYDK